VKKGIAVFICAALLSAAAFGADVSLGFGLRTGPLLGYGTKSNTPMPNYDTNVVQEEMGTAKSFYASGFVGFDVFFDVKYVEADVGVFIQPSVNEGIAGFLNFDLLLKYPFTITDQFTLFPLLGADYTVRLAMNDECGNFRARGDMDFKYKNSQEYPEVTVGTRHDELWFKVGIGGDTSLSGRVYLRNELLWGFRLNTTWEKEMIAYANEGGRDTTAFHHGVTYKLAVGFNLGGPR
jgi:hypothetical protein